MRTRYWQAHKKRWGTQPRTPGQGAATPANAGAPWWTRQPSRCVPRVGGSSPTPRPEPCAAVGIRIRTRKKRARVPTTPLRKAAVWHVSAHLRVGVQAVCADDQRPQAVPLSGSRRQTRGVPSCYCTVAFSLFLAFKGKRPLAAMRRHQRLPRVHWLAARLYNPPPHHHRHPHLPCPPLPLFPGLLFPLYIHTAGPRK